MAGVELEVSDGIATITLNRPKSLNALTAEDYSNLGEYLRQIDAMPDVVATILQGTGRYFCAGTDVRAGIVGGTNQTEREFFINGVTKSNTDVNRALYTHSKLLIAALNGPVLGIAAAFLGHFDFIYSTPEAWLSTPFSFLGINAEGGSSASFIDRMGVSKAKEALLYGKKLTSGELLACGFVNKTFSAASSDEFNQQVRHYVLDELNNLEPSALLASKKLLQAALRDRNDPDAINLRESYSQAQRFASRIPAARFAKIVNKELRHKL